MSPVPEPRVGDLVIMEPMTVAQITETTGVKVAFLSEIGTWVCHDLITEVIRRGETAEEKLARYEAGLQKIGKVGGAYSKDLATRLMNGESV